MWFWNLRAACGSLSLWSPGRIDTLSKVPVRSRSVPSVTMGPSYLHYHTIMFTCSISTHTL